MSLTAILFIWCASVIVGSGLTFGNWAAKQVIPKIEKFVKR